jgi:hypothetical protein
VVEVVVAGAAVVVGATVVVGLADVVGVDEDDDPHAAAPAAMAKTAAPVRAFPSK